MPPNKRSGTREKRKPINPAAAALGLGVQPDKWTTASIIGALERRYLQLIQIGDECMRAGRNVRSRLHYAGAFELAQVIASYHQDGGRTEEFGRWDRRKTRAQTQAFQVRNRVADAIGAATDAETSSEDDDSS